MVHKWLVKKARGLIILGLILFLIVGPIFFIFSLAYHNSLIERWYGYYENPRKLRHPTPPETIMEIIEVLKHNRIQSSLVGAIGVIVLITGGAYLLVTVILEHMKKRRHTHRSKI